MDEPRIINYNGNYVSFRQINHNSTIVKIDLKRIWSKEYSNYKKNLLIGEIWLSYLLINIYENVQYTKI